MADYLNGRCCVFQPFDSGGPYDKRFDDVIFPAIAAAGLEPYRVDKDYGALIPIDALHDEIRNARACLADITSSNPNVMYELGFAIASGRDVVIICGTQKPAEKYPFNIQHRGITQYANDSTRDFENLKATITNRLGALIKKQETTQTIVQASPVKSTDGLQPSEIAALALVMANVDASIDQVSTASIKFDMEKAGYTRLASQLALTRLTRLKFVEPFEYNGGYNNDPYIAYRILEAGENWLLDNQDKLHLRTAPKPSKRTPPVKIDDDFGGMNISDDEIPF